jgi:hypothetical protein
LLPGDELVRPTEEDLGRQVPAKFATERAFHGDGLKWKVIPASGHISAAPFAGDDEQSPLYAWEAECHCMSIGEIKANKIHRAGSNLLSEIYPRIYPKLIRLTREYRCLGGIPCAVKSLIVQVILSLTRKRSLVRIQSCLPYLSIAYGNFAIFFNPILSPIFHNICSAHSRKPEFGGCPGCN